MYLYAHLCMCLLRLLSTLGLCVVWSCAERCWRCTIPAMTIIPHDAVQLILMRTRQRQPPRLNTVHSGELATLVKLWHVSHVAQQSQQKL